MARPYSSRRGAIANTLRELGSGHARLDADDAVNVKRPSKASRNFAKPVSYKDITETMQKAVQSIEDTKRQYHEVLRNETIMKYCTNVFHCLRAWGLVPKSMGSKKQTWGLSDLESKLIANQI